MDLINQDRNKESSKYSVNDKISEYKTKSN